MAGAQTAGLKPFVKGVSGNPGGRPGVNKDAKKLAKANCHKAMQRLIELLDDEDSRVVIAAAREILDRGLGKAPAAPEDGDKGGGLTINILPRPEGVTLDRQAIDIVANDHAPERLDAPRVSIAPVGVSA